MASTTNELAIELKHDFNVPVATLFRAWTEFEHLQAWWRPMGARLVKLTNELRPGGSIRYAFENEESGQHFVVKGEYREVAENSQLVYTWIWEMPDEPVHEGSWLLRIAFDENGDRSTLQVRQEQFADEEAIQPHRDGWERELKRLEDYLARL